MQRTFHGAPYAQLREILPFCTSRNRQRHRAWRNNSQTASSYSPGNEKALPPRSSRDAETRILPVHLTTTYEGADVFYSEVSYNVNHRTGETKRDGRTLDAEFAGDRKKRGEKEGGGGCKKYPAI